MKGVFQGIRANSGTVSGVVGGFFVAGTAVQYLQNALGPVLGAKNARFAEAAAAGGLTLLAFVLAARAKGDFTKDACVGFGAVSLGHAVNGLLRAFGTQ